MCCYDHKHLEFLILSLLSCEIVDYCILIIEFPYSEHIIIYHKEALQETSPVRNIELLSVTCESNPTTIIFVHMYIVSVLIVNESKAACELKA